MHKIRLFLELASEARSTHGKVGHGRADGWVIGPRRGARSEAALDTYGNGCLVMMDVDPGEVSQRWLRRDTVWIAKGDPEVVARHRDRWPELRWVPGAEVYRPVARFDFQQQFHEEGFKTYVPDLSTYRRFRVAGTMLELGEWLRRVGELGFTCVWLHGADAAARGRGLDLDMIERGRRAWGGELWVSGGVTSPAHLVKLAEGDAPEVVVVPEDLVWRCGMQSLRRALAPRLAVEVQASTSEDSCTSHARGIHRCPGSSVGT